MSSTVELSGLINRLEAVVNRLEKTGGSGGSGGGDSAAVAQYVEDFNNFITDAVDPYVAASAALGGAIDGQAKNLKAVCDEQTKFLVIASKCSQPKDQAVLGKLMAAMSKLMGEFEDFRKKMTNDEKNHVLAVCEGYPVFGWVGYPKTPMKHVEECRESVKFYTNKVLMATKNGDKKAEHKAWVDSFINIFDSLHGYIKEHHRTGLSWNASAPEATANSCGGAPAVPPPPPQGVPPPPPPGASMPAPAPAGPSPMNALFNDLKKGTDITKGLKKVSNDMKTHKNPDLRKHSAVPFKASSSPGFKPVTSGKPKPAKKPPQLALHGKKWIVEHQENASALVIEGTEMSHTVYIYNCVKSTLTVKGKINSIVLDNCKKMGVVFESVVSGIEIINCQSATVQCQGTMPCASIDKTDGCLIYLSSECLDCEIVCAKSSEMNISVPKNDGSGEFDEHPLPEQFRIRYNKDQKKITSEAADSLG